MNSEKVRSLRYIFRVRFTNVRLVLSLLRKLPYFHHPWSHIPGRDVSFEVTMRRLR